MNRRGGLLAALGWSAAVCSPQVLSQGSSRLPAPPVSELKALGKERFQIGRIVVDKRAGSFTVPGRVHVFGKPLEYLATSTGGMKAYESLLELDAIGSEFNLACILVGLDRDPKQASWRQTGLPARLVGQRVALSVAWSEAGQRRQISAAEALLDPQAGAKPDPVEWVYIGSPISDAADGFAADRTGTLIGFVHDANSIIESVAAIGVGAYGSVRGGVMLPPEGSAIELVVDVANAAR